MTPLGCFKQNALEGAQPRGARPQEEDGVLRRDPGDPGGPEPRGQQVPGKEGLAVGDGVRDLGEALVCVGHPDILRLAPVDAAAQGPAPVGVGAVVHIPTPAEKARPAEGLHVHRHPVSRAELGHVGPYFLHHPHHLVAQGDPRHRPGHGPVLDVQVTGADAGQGHPDDGVPGMLQGGLWLVL